MWRELRRLGAVGLQQGTWVVPDGEPFEAGFMQVVEVIKAAGGKPVVLAIAAEEASESQLEVLFTALREAEWGEFVSDCGKYEVELAGEVVKGKLTLAELDEEEQSLDRLRRWPNGGSRNARRRWKGSPSRSTKPGNRRDRCPAPMIQPAAASSS